MVHQERREQSRCLINPDTERFSSSHLSMPGLGSCPLGYGLHLPECTGLGYLRMALVRITDTARHCYPVLPHSRAWIWGNRVPHPLQDQRDGGQAGKSSAQRKQFCGNPASLLKDTQGEGARLVPRGWSGAEGTCQGSHAQKTIREVPGAKVYLVPVMAQRKGSGFVATPVTCKIMSG